MPWVLFVSRFDWRPPQLRNRVTISYRPGNRYLVTTPCAVAAVEAGKAEKADNPRKAHHASR